MFEAWVTNLKPHYREALTEIWDELQEIGGVDPDFGDDVERQLEPAE